MKQRVLLSGKDAVDLLHRLSTINVQGLALDTPTPALLLNPQAKIISFFTATLKSATEIEIEFQENFLEVLDQYTFAERYQIQPLPLKDEAILSEKARIEQLSAAIGKEFLENGLTNPLEVNLGSAIHDGKGCYPGQEVIEKIISLGSPAKRLALVEGANADELPALLFAENGTEAGTLTSFFEDVGLAILKRTHLTPGLKLKTKTGSLTVKKVSS